MANTKKRTDRGSFEEKLSPENKTARVEASNMSSHSETDDEPTLMVAIDFKKAFDSLEWLFIKLSMIKFNFGDNIIRWVSIFYQNIQTAVLNNGFMTNFFQVSRGVRQGCPLSPYLFILCAEILAHKIRGEENIKGIEILNEEIKLTQFADDTTLFCADILSVNNALILLQKFGKISGLCLNERKTKAVWLGKR